MSRIDEFEDILGRIGDDKRGWLARLWKSTSIQQEPIMGLDGEILEEPLFWFSAEGCVTACFCEGEPGHYTLHKLEDNNTRAIRPGQKDA